MKSPDDHAESATGEFRWVPNPAPRLGWWAAWRSQLPMTVTMTVGWAIIMLVRYGVWPAVVTVTGLLALSLVIAPLGYYFARPKRIKVSTADE